jgi:hypothetical protein
MFIVLLTTLIAVQAGAAPRLPDTPQGRHVAAFMQAFNTGDEKKFLDAEETLMSKPALTRRSAAERGQMFRRMQGDFGTLKVQKVMKATPDEITVVVPTTQGDDAVFTFMFEKDAPFRVAGLSVDIRGGDQD